MPTGDEIPAKTTIASAVETGLTDALWARLTLVVAVLGWLATVALALLAIWSTEPLSTRYSNTAGLTFVISIVLTFLAWAAAHNEKNNHSWGDGHADK
jgi:uncharacterized membrane protein YqjE